MAIPLRVLLIEDNEDDARLVVRQLRSHGYDTQALRVETPAALTRALDEHAWDIVISDYSLPHFDALAALTVVQARPDDLPFIVVSGKIGEETAVATLKAGAHDYVMKDRLGRLAVAVEREVREAKNRRERRQTEATLREHAARLQFLHEYSARLNAMSQQESIEAYVATAVREHTGATLVLVSRYLPERRTLETRYASTDSRILELAGKILKMSVIGFRSKVPDDVYQKILDAQVAILNDAHEASFGAVPKTVATLLGKALGVGKFVALPLVHQRQLWGTIMAVLPERAVLPDLPTLEIVAELTAQTVARRETQERFQVSFERSSIGKTLTSCEGILLRVNDAFATMLGYARDEMEGRPFDEFTHPEDKANSRKNLDHLLTGAPACRFEKRYLRKDGSVLWTDANIAAVRDAAGQTQYFISGFVDITERKRSRAALAASEENFRLLTERSAVGVYVIQDDLLVYVNPLLAKTFGYEPHEIAGKLRPADLIHPDDLPAVTRRTQERLAGRTEESNLAYRAIKKDGSLIHIEVFGTAVQFGGRPAVMGTLIEVTERVRAQAALVASETRVREILDNMQDAYLRVGGDGRIAMVSPSAVSLYGYGSMQEMIGLPAPVLYASEDERRGLLERLGRDGSVRDYIGQGRRQDGSCFWVSLNARRLADGQAECFVRDISERKRAEETLRASEEKYRKLHESMRDGYAFVTLDGVIRDSNQAFRDMVGYQPEELARLTYVDLTPACWHEMEAAIVRDQILVRGYSDVYEKDYRRKDGTIIPIELRSFLIGDEAGHPQGVWAIVRDITQRRQQTQELRLKDAAIAHSTNAIAIAELDGRLRYVNGAWERLHGYPAVEVVGRNATELWPDDVAWFSQALGQAQSTVCERAMQRKDGAIFYAQVSVSLVLDERGQPSGVLVSEVDVTERRFTQQALMESQILLRSIVDGTTDMVWSVDPVTFGLTFFNHGLRDHFLRVRRIALAMGMRPEDMYPTEHFVSTWRAFYQRALQEVSYNIEYPGIAGDRVLDLTFNLLRREGAAYGICVFAKDITGRKQAQQERERLEDQLRVSQKMDAIGRLAGGVAHDFNNLLSVILSYTGFAIDQVPDGDPCKRDLAQVRKAAESAASLTRQLLAFSRKQVLQPVPLDLNQIVAGVEAMLRRIVGEDIVVVQALAPDLGLTLADPGQIEQVLMNLVVNARDAMPDGGTLTIATANVEIDGAQAAELAGIEPGPFVALAMSDTGCGIDQATQARLFEPFFTTKEKGKGTGLGLSMAFGFVKQSGGDIQVMSEPGRGSTFRIYLPRATAPAAMAQPEVPGGLPTGEETILVVEDEEALREAARRSLMNAGYQVVAAANGIEALRLWEEHNGRFDLVLTDVIMPEMSGKTLASRLAEASPGTKILFMSGYTDDTIAHHGILDPGTHFIAKPFTPSGLALKVREVLDVGLGKAAPREVAAPVQSEASVADRAAFRALPADIQRNLLDSAAAARYVEICRIIETVRLTAPQVAATLQELADRFDYEGIKSLFR
jgi:two-component system, cell cycle sensor histidine kinase and response regulator CckA